MENWGLLTYRLVLFIFRDVSTFTNHNSTTALLFDEAKSDQRFKTRVAYVVSHELAHQWFGNLVTMDWWNEVRTFEREWPMANACSSYGSKKASLHGSAGLP
jgi:aminopeptidase N